jgi:hypothetical protein
MRAEPEVAYLRFEHFRHQRDRANFMQAEFNEHRTRLYRGADNVIDPTRESPEETRDEFARNLAMSWSERPLVLLCSLVTSVDVTVDVTEARYVLAGNLTANDQNNERSYVWLLKFPGNKEHRLL